MKGVTLVIAARNAEATIGPCLDAVTRLLAPPPTAHDQPSSNCTDSAMEGVAATGDAPTEPSLDRGQGQLAEIILVDDGSTDRTAEIAATRPVRIVAGPGQGAAAARNLGWQAAATPLIWFVDADCVAEPDALRLLLPSMADGGVAAAGGSYTNLQSDSLLATLIHEEIVARHRRMSAEVTVLASFHLLYDRGVLEEIGGFDVSCRWAHDAELAYRVRKAGYRLRFEIDSRVGHFHPVKLRSYLAKQRAQGYWRVMLYRRHPERMAGDSYSGWWDFVQPPLAVLTLATLPLMVVPPLGKLPTMLPTILAITLLLVQLPMTRRIVSQTRQWRHLSFAVLSFVRAFWRGVGMVMGIASRHDRGG